MARNACRALSLIAAALAAADGYRLGHRALHRSVHPQARPTLPRAAVSSSTAVEGEVAAAPTRGPPPELTIPGDTLETLPSHVAWTAASTALVLFLLGRAFLASWAHAAIALATALALGDVVTAFIHFGTDNYGNMDTPVVGHVCAAFQGHHKAPWTITHRSFYNNVHKIARTAIPPTLLAAATLPPAGAAFVACLLYTQLLAQEFHRWSHCLPGDLAPWQRRLQDSGLILTRAEHLRHHQAPFHAHYAIFLGAANPALDALGVFRRLERWIYRWNGVEPNCWKEEKGGSDVRRAALR